MLKLFSLLVVTFFLMTSTALFAESNNVNEAKCKQWAQEEGVEQDEMNEYIADCLESIAEEIEQDSK